MEINVKSTAYYTDVGIIGAGPAGIFTAYKLIELSMKYGKKLKITIFEKGKDIYDRKCPKRENENSDCLNCNPCAIMHGFGGAGTFSDCKLSLTPHVGGDLLDYRTEKKLNEYIKEVDDIISSFDINANKRKISSSNTKHVNEIKETAEKYYIDFIDCPTKHLGTDGTYNVMKLMRDYLINMDVKILYNFDADVILNGDYPHKNIIINCKSGDYYICNKLVFAVGRSGSEKLKQFCENNDIEIKSKGADIGVRVETNSNITDKITDVLYDMKFSYKDYETGHSARTFCTNPKGYVSEEHYGNYAVVNGHSFSDKKSDRTNFAILVSTDYNSDFARELVKTANKYSENKIIVNNFFSFVRNSDPYTNYPYVYPVDKHKMTLKNANYGIDLSKFLPIEISKTIVHFIEQLSYLMPGLNTDLTYIYGIETKFYSDTIITDEDFRIKHYEYIYAIGDGAGITRGIIQSAISGIIAAKDIFKRIN